VQAATGESVGLAYVDQGYIVPKPATAAQAHGMRLEVVKLPEAQARLRICCPAHMGCSGTGTQILSLSQ
jgi:hypothetical protein